MLDFFTWASEELIPFLKLQHKNFYYLLEIFKLSYAYVLHMLENTLNHVRNNNAGEGTAMSLVSEQKVSEMISPANEVSNLVSGC